MKLQEGTWEISSIGLLPNFAGRHKVVFLLSAFLISFFVCLLPSEARSQTVYRVNTTSDTIVAGACANPPTAGCSLRGAMQAAQAATSFIEFAIPASDPFCAAGVCTINLTQTLPSIIIPIDITGPGADKLIVKPAIGISIAIINVTANGPTAISGLTIKGGFAANGGGINKTGSGTLTLNRVVLTENKGTLAGGGVDVSAGGLRVFNSTIMSNQGALPQSTGVGGGGIRIAPGSICEVTNSTIIFNTTGTNGGGIANYGTLNLTNSTIAGNQSRDAKAGFQNRGGGIFNGIGATATIKSTISAFNFAATAGTDVHGSFVSAGFNLISVRDGSTGFTAGTDQTGTAIGGPLNPKFDPSGLQNNGGTTRTISLLSGSPAIDRGSSQGLTGILTTDQRGSLRISDDHGVPNAVGGDGTDIGAVERRESPADFDGDGRTDISIFRPSPGEWWYLRSSSDENFSTQFGGAADKIAPADFTGDGKTDIAFWRPSTGVWFVLRSEDSSFFSFPFGTTGDIPAPADFDGDGKADAAVFRPSASTWFIQRSGGGTDFIGFGAPGDKSVVGDYDGDGRSDIAIWRPSVGQWWVRRSSNQSIFAVTFGTSTDKAVQGDYTGDGKTDVAFWRPSTGSWFILRSEDFSFFSFPFGTTGDTPSPGDYDGDGRFDATVFRSSNSTWFSQRTSTGVVIQQFGASSDLPVPASFVP